MTPVNLCVYNKQQELMHVSHHAAGAVTLLAALNVSAFPLFTLSPLTDSILISTLSKAVSWQGHKQLVQVGSSPKRHSHKGSQAEQCSTKQQTGSGKKGQKRYRDRVSES